MKFKKYIEGYPKTTKVADWRYDVDEDGNVRYYEYATGLEFVGYCFRRTYAWFGFFVFWGGFIYAMTFLAPALWEVITMDVPLSQEVLKECFERGCRVIQ